MFDQTARGPDRKSDGNAQRIILEGEIPDPSDRLPVALFTCGAGGLRPPAPEPLTELTVALTVGLTREVLTPQQLEGDAGALEFLVDQ